MESDLVRKIDSSKHLLATAVKMIDSPYDASESEKLLRNVKKAAESKSQVIDAAKFEGYMDSARASIKSILITFKRLSDAPGIVSDDKIESFLSECDRISREWIVAESAKT